MFFEASSVCVSVLQPLETPPSFFLLDYFLSGIEFTGKGFHGVVLAPLRLNSISDTLIEAEEGSPFIFLPWQAGYTYMQEKNDVLMVAEKREVYGDMETKIVKD